MGNLSSRIERKVNRAAGSSFWMTFLLTSSNFTTAQKALTGAVSGGSLIVEKVIFSTDGTGLAGMTNVEIGVSGETYGLDKPVVEAQSNLGANAFRVAPHSAASGDTTNDNHMTVTAAVPFVLRAGNSLQYSGSSSAGTGAGIVLVAIKFTRVNDEVDIVSAV